MENKGQNGNVLMYALLIIAAILSTTIAISNFMQSSLIQTRYLNDGQAALYSAESAAERLIYLIRREEQIPADGDCGLADLDCEWEIKKDVVEELKLDLDENQKLRFALYDPERDYFGGDVRSIEFMWDAKPPAVNPPRLDVTLRTWDWKIGSSGRKIYLMEETEEYFEGGYDVFTELEADYKYLIDIEAHGGAARNLRVKIYRDGFQSQPKTFPDFLRLNLTGRHGDSSRKLTVDMLKYVTMEGGPEGDGVFDYVRYQ